MGAPNTTNLQIVLTTDGAGNVTASLAGVAGSVRAVKPAADEAKSGLDSLKSSIEAIKHLMEAWGVYEVLREVIGAFFDANAAAAQLTATLTGVTGSASEAAQTLEVINSVAERSTASTSDLVDAYVRLANAGIKPTMQLMGDLANVAVLTNTSVTTVADAFALAGEGSTRALRQLGITAKVAGDQMIVTFRGASEVIDNSRQGVAD
jgi:hypothetical protein